jgi:ABC-type multidrug transport system ATPase subunit
LLASEGSATVAGFDVVLDYKAILNSMGFMPEKFSFIKICQWKKT